MKSITQDDNSWQVAKTKYPEQPEKQCEGLNCLNKFRPTGPWGGRRCERCKREKRPYKDIHSPF